MTAKLPGCPTVSLTRPPDVAAENSERHRTLKLWTMQSETNQMSTMTSSECSSLTESTLTEGEVR